MDTSMNGNLFLVVLFYFGLFCFGLFYSSFSMLLGDTSKWNPLAVNTKVGHLSGTQYENHPSVPV